MVAADGAGGRHGLAGGEVAVVGVLPHRVDVELDRVAEQPAEGLQDAALEVLVVLLVEDLEEVVDAHGDADHLLRVAAEVGGQPVVLRIVGDEDGEADVAEQVHARKEIPGIERPRGQQVVHGYLHEDDDALALDRGLLDELRRGTVQHVDVHMGDRAEAAALDQDRLLVEDLRGLQDGAVGSEHHRVGQAELHQVKRHEAIVHLLEGGAAELQHVDLDAVRAQVVEKGLDQLLGVRPVVEGAVDDVDADDAQGLLLEHVLPVPHPHVQEDVARLRVGLGLEPDAHPAVGLVVALEVLGRDRVGEDEEGGVLAAGGREALDQQLVFMVEHEPEAFAGHVPGGLAIDGAR